MRKKRKKRKKKATNEKVQIEQTKNTIAKPL